MPTWQPQPPEPATTGAYRIIRTPADKPLNAISTSPQLIGTSTHYANHRTTPCASPARCQLCEAGHSTRWHGYLGVLLTASMEHAIMEITANAWPTLQSYQNQHDSLRGCGIIAKRPSGRANGRVVLKCIPVDLQKWHLPAAPYLIKLLNHIWGIADPNVLQHESDAAYLAALQNPQAALNLPRPRDLTAHKRNGR